MRILLTLFFALFVSMYACEDTDTEDNTGNVQEPADQDLLPESDVVEEADVVQTPDVTETPEEDVTDEETTEEVTEPEPEQDEEDQGDPTAFENTKFQVEFVPTIPGNPGDDD